jgi:hypothetical protein
MNIIIEKVKKKMHFDANNIIHELPVSTIIFRKTYGYRCIDCNWYINQIMI